MVLFLCSFFKLEPEEKFSKLGDWPPKKPGEVKVLERKQSCLGGPAEIGGGKDGEIGGMMKMMMNGRRKVNGEGNGGGGKGGGSSSPLSRRCLKEGRKQLFQALRLKERKTKLKGLKEGQKGMKGCLDQAKQRKQRREKESKPGKTAGLVVDKEVQKGLKEGPNLFLSTDQDKEIGALSGKKDEERGPGKAGRKTEKISLKSKRGGREA